MSDSTIVRLHGRLELQFEEPEIQPPAELEPGVMNRAGMGKAERLMKRDACGVRHVDAGDDEVMPLCFRAFDQRLHG